MHIFNFIIIVFLVQYNINNENRNKRLLQDGIFRQKNSIDVKRTTIFVYSDRITLMLILRSTYIDEMHET